jgi:4-carboxymuconolactone decarboxylase
MLSPAQAAVYRKIAIGDETAMTSLFLEVDGLPTLLEAQMSALARLAALIMVDAGSPAYQRQVRIALGAGASPDQITGVLLAIAPIAGSSLVMSAAPKLAMALGYDVDAGLEDGDLREDDI